MIYQNKKFSHSEQIQFGTYGSLPLDVTILKAENPQTSILYFHGGGFLYGHREDIPKTYVQKLMDAGVSIFLFDYPLAPEAPLFDIYTSACSALEWFLTEGWKLSGAPSKDYYLFGRSAGGYLATVLTAKFAQPHQRGLIRFYGYQDLFRKEFLQPARFYTKFPKVPPISAEAIIANQPITEGSLERRFPLYLSARQYGNWHRYLGQKEQLDLLVIPSTAYKYFPPCFVAHCTKDPDVPCDCSKEFVTQVPSAKGVWLDLEQHDFDRTPNTIAENCYQQLIEWLDI
jgi:acetyl esterase